jgi:ketosteroid isomerase-like protein
MGTAESLQIVKDGFAAFGRGDLSGLLSLMAEDVVWDIPGGSPLSGAYRGQEGVASFFQKLGEQTEILDFQPREFVADGERVLVVGWERVKVKATGRSADIDWVMSFTVRNGKVAAYRQYTDTKAIAEAFTSAAASAAGG